MTERFSGRITLDEGDEVDVDLELSDAEVRLTTESAEIGVWPRPDCQFVDAGDGVYQLMVDDDVVNFVPTEGETFGRALYGSNGAKPLEPAPSDDESSAEEASEPFIDENPDEAGLLAGVSDEVGSDDLADEVSDVGTQVDTTDSWPFQDLQAHAEAGDDGFFVSVEQSWDTEDSSPEHPAAESARNRSDSALEGQVPTPRSTSGVEDEPSPFVETSPLADDVEGTPLDAGEPVAAPSSFFMGFEDQDEADAFTAVPAASEVESGDDPPDATATEDVDYEELASALEELADQQAAESAVIEDAADAEPEATIDLEDEKEGESEERRGFGWFRGRASKPDETVEEEESEAALNEADEAEEQEDDDSRTRGWFVDPSTAAKEPKTEPEPEGSAPEDKPKVRSTERLAAAVGALKDKTLTPAEQAIADARGDSPSVISTEDVIASQRSLRQSNVVRRLTWDLVRKVGAGVLLGVGLAVLVVLFPDAWDVLTRDSEPPVVTEDPATSTTIDAVQATTTQPITTTTVAITTSTTGALPGLRESIFELRGADFFDRWNQAAIPIDRVLGFGVYPPPGAFENEFYPYLSMTGLVGEDGTLDGFSVVVDPTGPSDSDWLAIQALGVAIAVAEPDLSGSERADLLGTLGLNVRQPELGGIDGVVERGPYRYQLVFNEEATLLTLTISPAGTPLPDSDGN